MIRTRFARSIRLIVSILAGCSRSTVEDTATNDAPQSSPMTTTTNACGGTETLPAGPNEACGVCGLYACSSQNVLRCDDPGANTCGICGKIPQEECNGRDDNCNGVIDEGCVLKLAALRTNDQQARVSGTRVVFRAAGYWSNASDVGLVLLPGFNLEIVSPHAEPTDGPGDPSQELDPDIDGELVVWTSRRVDPLSDVGTLVGYDARTKTSFLISSLATTHPAVSKARVAFETKGTSEYEDDIMLWERATGSTRTLTDKTTDDRAPDLDGEWVVFTQGSGVSPYFNRQVVAYNLTTDERLVLSDGLGGWNTQPAISGTRAVWRHEEGNQAPSYYGEIWLYDLTTHTRTKLSLEKKDEYPRISGSLVCWSTISGEPGGITLLDVSSGRRKTLSSEGSICDIDGRRVVWSEYHGSNDVYVRELLENEP